MRYCLSVDLGTENDYTAISIIERLERVRDKNMLNVHQFKKVPLKIISELRLIKLERAPLKVTYPEVVDAIKLIMNNPRFVGDISLVVDRTGVGLPVMQMMYTTGLSPIGISIHGGTEVGFNGDHYNVPKRDLAMAILTAYQMGRFKTPSPAKMPIIKDFKEELSNFKMKITKTGHDTYEAWKSRIHDDLVMSVAMGIWWMDKIHGTETEKTI